MDGYILQQRAVIIFMRKTTKPTPHLFMEQKEVGKGIENKIKNEMGLV
jgi:hypothetical protein